MVIPQIQPQSSISQYVGTAATFLDTDGQLVVLSFDGIVNSARYLCRNDVHSVRKYTFDRVFKYVHELVILSLL